MLSPGARCCAATGRGRLAGWVLSPLIVALAALALLAVLSPGQPVAVWRAWPQELPWLMVGYAVLACAGPARLTWQTRNCVKRVRQIVTRPADGPQVFEVDPPPLGPPPAAVGTGRRIVIFCDGTKADKPDQLSEGIAAPTNVYKLFTHLAKSEAQTGWYDAGVGTETSSEFLAGKTLNALAKMMGWVKATLFGAFVKFRTLIEAGFGVGITENIVQAYTEIVRRYRPGDRITSWASHAAPTRRVAWPA